MNSISWSPASLTLAVPVRSTEPLAGPGGSLESSTSTAAEAPGPRSPWPESASRPPAPQDEVEVQGLGALGKALGYIMDMPRPTRNKMLSGEQIEEIRQTLQPGDVLLETNDEYPGWQLNAKLFLKSDWVHAALYVGNGQIIDATTERNGVAPIDLDRFAKCHHLAVIRPHYKTEQDRDAAVQYAHASIGVPYDYDWSLDNDTQYCTEFVANALKAGPNPIEVPTMRVAVTGQDMVSPNAFLESPEMHTVFTTGSNYYMNMLQRARPFALQCALGASAGLLAGMVGAGPAVSTAIGVAVGGALFIGSMHRIRVREEQEARQ